MKKINVRKYFIMGSQDCPAGEDPVDILQDAIDAGISLFQFREKGPKAMVGAEKVKLGHALRSLCATHQIPFIVNDDVELVDILAADGIHVGQDDMQVSILRDRFPNAIIGLSISNMKEFTASKDMLPFIDYIGAGPVYSTQSKLDAKAAVGLEWIRQIRQMTPVHIPIVGIGGIQAHNAPDLIHAGADGVSVISAICQAGSRKERFSVIQAL